MAYVVGVVIFAFGLLFSVCLHEAGHMTVAKVLGMRVSRYFVGFGPTIFSFRRGETEYGLKAIPAGGFVSIDGMSPHVIDTPAEHEQQAFWRAPVWKRTAVMLAGSVTHFLLAIVLLWAALSAFGIERSVDPATAPARLAAISDCVVVGYDTLADGGLRGCRAGDPPAPAKAAGLQQGDVITAVGARQTPTLADFQDALRKANGAQPLPITYTRDGATATTTVTPVVAKRPPVGATDTSTLVGTPTIGVVGDLPSNLVREGPISGLGSAFTTAGGMVKATFTALGSIPSKVPALIDAVTGAPRDPNSPVSVVGASRAGGEILGNQGIGGIAFFLALLAGTNIFLGVFNLVPLPPLDGGHIAVMWFERIRSRIALSRGRPDPGFVRPERIAPVVMVFIAIFGTFALLAVVADVVNPVKLF
ncbi:MAG TPA: site-2 protease family protein [Mycobacteriales bacterium]|jgi:membrane-associated protease RseP (regulator of RpoE activity)|nr:site-2 protease family protein [Mycobacteriales bacterium]